MKNVKLPLLVTDLGTADYRKTWAMQREIQQELIAQKRQQRDASSGTKDGPTETINPKEKMASPALPDQLLLVEHPHVYTLGKSGDRANLLKGLAELAEIDAEFIEIDRGGDITYHGPGQLVAYPILDLDRHFTDIHRYLRELEEVVIGVCAEYRIEAGRIQGLTGVWVGDQKICAFGIRSSRWVTMHGLALNVNTDLAYFGHIIPCGIQDKQVCSLASLLGRPVEMEEVKGHLVRHFCERFDVDPVRQVSSAKEAGAP